MYQTNRDNFQDKTSFKIFSYFFVNMLSNNYFIYLKDYIAQYCHLFTI